MKISEKNFLKEAFKALDSQGVVHAVLRNADTLPDSLGGGDIDILVMSGRLGNAVRSLVVSAKSCGGKVMGVCRYPHFCQMMFMGCSEGSWWGCCIDLFEGVFCQGILPLAGDDLLEKRIQTPKGIWTVDGETGQYLGFVKELVTNGVISKRYMPGAKLAVEGEKDMFLPSKSLRRFVMETLSGEYHSITAFRKLWSASLFLKHPFSFLRNWCGFQSARLCRLIRPCGKMIAVMGTDGAGKTTLLNEILPVLRTMNHNSTVVHHLKPDLLPPLGRLRGVNHESGYVCMAPHASKPSSFVGSIFRVLYLVADYLLGYWLRVRIKLAKTPIAYWIFDRYAYDLLIDPRRFRVKLPAWVTKMLLFLVPCPDLVLCLGGDAEKVYARKPETSVFEVARQVSALKAFCDSNKRAVWIDTTASLEECANMALQTILERLSLRGECCA